MSAILKTILFAVVGLFVWKIFFKKRTALENTLDEQVGLQRLGDIAVQTNIAMQPITSFLGPFPLAAANLDPIYAQPTINTSIDFNPTFDGQVSGRLPQPVEDYLISWATGANDPRVFGLGPQTAIP